MLKGAPILSSVREKAERNEIGCEIQCAWSSGSVSNFPSGDS